MRTYKIIDHTADFSFQVFGKDLEELFINSAYALIEIMFGAENKLPKFHPDLSGRKFKIDLKSSDQESLLIDWLREIHYLAIVEKEIIRKIQNLVIKDLSISAEIEMQKIDLIPENEIKAITYSDIQIKEENGILSFVIVCDV